VKVLPKILPPEASSSATHLKTSYLRSAVMSCTHWKIRYGFKDLSLKSMSMVLQGIGLPVRQATMTVTPRWPRDSITGTTAGEPPPTQSKKTKGLVSAAIALYS
jgi:hypothetical protein